MAFIDVDEQVPVEHMPPTGRVETTNQINTTKSLGKKRFGYGLAVIVVIFVAFQFVRLNNEAKKLEQQVAGQSTAEQSQPDHEAQNLAEEIGQYLELPDETPTVATVSDASKVKTQPFFANAQDDDKILLFEKSGRAVLYRPSTRKVIEFATTN